MVESGRHDELLRKGGVTIGPSLLARRKDRIRLVGQDWRLLRETHYEYKIAVIRIKAPQCSSSRGGLSYGTNPTPRIAFPREPDESALELVFGDVPLTIEREYGRTNPIFEKNLFRRPRS